MRIFPASLLAAICLCVLSCDQEEDPIPINPSYTVSYEIGSIDTLAGETGSYDFCTDVEFRQLAQGSRYRGNYSSTGGIRFGPFSDRVEHIATRLLGRNGDPTNGNTTNLFPNVELAMQGSPDVQPYVDIEVVVNQTTYYTVLSTEGRYQIDHYDRSARQQIDYSFETGGSCRRGNALLIRTDLTYDGYAYNFYDLTDSIRLANLEATLYNYSF